MEKHNSSRTPLSRQEAASESVPPDSVHNAGWSIWDGLSGGESQPRQLGGCLFRIVGNPYNCEMVKVLKIERRTPVNLGCRIVPSLQVAVTRRRGALLSSLRTAKRTLRVEVLLG